MITLKWFEFIGIIILYFAFLLSLTLRRLLPCIPFCTSFRNNTERFSYGKQESFEYQFRMNPNVKWILMTLGGMLCGFNNEKN